MLEIHNQISSNNSIKLPAFPPKKWPGNLNPDFISQRQKSLENYFNNLLKVVNLENVPVLKQFLYQSYKKKEKVVEKPIVPDNPKVPNKPVKDLKEKEEQKEAPMSHISLKPNFDKIVENTRFVDLNTNLASPDEDDVKEKKDKYKTLNFNLKIKFPKMFSLPENQISKLDELINKQSLPNKEQAFVQELKSCMDNLIKNLENFDNFSMKTQMIHCFQS